MVTKEVAENYIDKMGRRGVVVVEIYMLDADMESTYAYARARTLGTVEEVVVICTCTSVVEEETCTCKHGEKEEEEEGEICTCKWVMVAVEEIYNKTIFRIVGVRLFRLLFRQLRLASPSERWR